MKKFARILSYFREDWWRIALSILLIGPATLFALFLWLPHRHLHRHHQRQGSRTTGSIVCSTTP